MQIVTAFTIMVNSTEVSFCHGSIHVTDDYLVLGRIEINLGFEGNLFSAELDGIDSMVHVK